MSTEGAKKPTKPGFALPPARRPQSAEEFIAGAGQPPSEIVAAAPASSTPASSEGRLPWEGEDDSHRRGLQPYRLTQKEIAALDFILKNKPGVRSRHAYVLEALLTAMTRDVKQLSGEDIKFSALSTDK